MADGDIEAPQGQRDFVRSAVWRLIEKHKADLAAEYAQAEQSDMVTRKSNDYGMDAVRYGERLLDDARRKGWL